MKKGCFFTAITLFTIIIATGLYVYKKYWKEIRNYGKSKLMEFTLEEMNQKIDALGKSAYRDSLKIFLTNEIKEFEKMNDDKSFEQFQNLIDQTKYFIHDGIIDSLDMIALKNMVKKNERSEKNRN
jgi:preprotein translocase subunit Sec63